MPQRRCAVKDLRKNYSRWTHNLDIKTDLRKTIKKYLGLIKQKNKAEAISTLQIVYKKSDKAAKRRILEKNTAARRKSRFSRLLASLT